MAGRPNKVGLDYFELDCHMEEKVRLIQAEFGLKGFSVIVKLYQKIYGQNGYYCEWNEDVLLLFLVENGLNGDSKNLISEIVLACIRRDIFSDKLFKKYGILTSSGVQKRYLNATSKREVVDMKKEYLLISVDKNNKNVVINSINVFGNSINAVENSQSRVEKSKEENKKIIVQSALALFESLWKLYPCKKGKGQVLETQKLKLLDIGFEEMSRAVERYKKEWEKDKEWRKEQNGSTFFNSGYVDYLDENYVPGKKRSQGKSKGQFNNFQQNEYDFDELEEELLSN